MEYVWYDYEFFFDYDTFPPCYGEDVHKAHNYHYNKYFYNNQPTPPNSEQFDYIVPLGLRAALKRFYFLEDKSQDYEDFVRDVLTQKDQDLFTWCRLNVTSFIGDFVIGLVQMEMDGYIKHPCRLFTPNYPTYYLCRDNA